MSVPRRWRLLQSRPRRWRPRRWRPLGLGLAALAVALAAPLPVSNSGDGGGHGWRTGSAWAQSPTAPIVNRDYVIDLYHGAAMGSARIVGMGGTAVAVAEGSASALATPAAPAVRAATSNSQWDWDWHVDWLSPFLSSDLDNNGRLTADDDAAASSEFIAVPVITIGGVVQYQEYGFGFNLLLLQNSITTTTGNVITPAFTVGRAAIARALYDGQLIVGGGFRFAQFDLSLTPRDTDPDDAIVPAAQTLFDISGVSVDAGLLFRPRDRNLRLGVSGALPIVGTEVGTEVCDPNNCAGYILPREVQVPWQISAGAAWRWAQTRWNRQVASPWRDENYLMLTAEVIVTGAVAHGYGMEAFVEKTLQPSGRSTSVSLRAGAEYEWIPGWLRVRAGSYWEPARFDNIAGRVHGTGGLDARIWTLRVRKKTYRMRLSLTADLATRYFNTGLSIGFWH